MAGQSLLTQASASAGVLSVVSVWAKQVGAPACDATAARSEKASAVDRKAATHHTAAVFDVVLQRIAATEKWAANGARVAANHAATAAAAVTAASTGACTAMAERLVVIA